MRKPNVIPLPEVGDVLAAEKGNFKVVGVERNDDMSFVVLALDPTTPHGLAGTAANGEIMNRVARLRKAGRHV